MGAFDARWDAIGAGAEEGDVVNVVGTSTCIIAYVEHPELIPGVCGVVDGSVHPRYTGAGFEAGLSATGDIFSAIAQQDEYHGRGTSAGVWKAARRPENGLLA